MKTFKRSSRGSCENIGLSVLEPQYSELNYLPAVMMVLDNRFQKFSLVGEVVEDFVISHSECIPKRLALRVGVV